MTSNAKYYTLHLTVSPVLIASKCFNSFLVVNSFFPKGSVYTVAANKITAVTHTKATSTSKLKHFKR